MKKFLRITVMSILAVVLITAFGACDKKLSEAEKEVVGKYEVIEISIAGYPQVSASNYEYFTMEFYSNKKCNVKSKAGVTEYDADAKWKINSDGEIEVITTQGFAKATEKYRYEDGIITGTNSTMFNGSTIEMTIKLQKIVESNEE